MENKRSGTMRGIAGLGLWLLHGAGQPRSWWGPDSKGASPLPQASASSLLIDGLAGLVAEH